MSWTFNPFTGALDRAPLAAAAQGAANTVQLSNGAGAFLAATGVTSPGAGRLALAAGTVTASAPILDATQTWNSSGTTFTGIAYDVTDTASAAGSMLMDLRVGGSGRFNVRKDGLLTAAFAVFSNGAGVTINFNEPGARFPNTGVLSWTNGAATNPSDLALVRDAAGILAQRNGTAAQAFRVYRTFTDASNGEWASMRWSGTTLEIGAFANGTGAAREVHLLTGGITRLTIPTTGGILVGDMVVGRGLGQVDTNTATGREALINNTTGNSNTAFGRDALRANTTGANNTAVGRSALSTNTDGNNNTAVGPFALFANNTGVNNTAVGRSALLGNTTGSNNTSIGLNALADSTVGFSNTAVGEGAIQASVAGLSNTAFGRSALRRIAGNNNVAAGFEAGFNVSRGVATLGSITGGSGYTDGTYNGVTLQRSSGSTFTTSATANITVAGGAVTAISLVTSGAGFQSTDTVLTATAASIGGTGSGFSVPIATLTGAVSDENTLIGFRAASNQTQGSRNIAIGANAQLDSLTGSDQINIGGRYFHDRFIYTERADPAAPAADQAVVYVRDNGSGKTQLCVRFSSGAVQVLATEP